jgi:hypothetical protein
MRSDGLIIGEGISQQNNSFTSRLSVNFTQGLVGSTIDCLVDDGSGVDPIGNSVLEFSTSKFIHTKSYNHHSYTCNTSGPQKHIGNIIIHQG